MTTSAPERAFAFFERGTTREDILTNFRIGLRSQVNPDTGIAFTEDEIAFATQQGSRWWREAEAIDLALLARQSRALFLADQVDPTRASDAWLFSFHANLWDEQPLSAAGASGTVTAKGTYGTTYAGSTTVPDPLGLACVARDPAGLRYQVTVEGIITDTVAGVELTLQAIDTGTATNHTWPASTPTAFTWENPPSGSQPTATQSGEFGRGSAAETAADFQTRLLARIRHKQGAGNNAQMRAWARKVSVSVQDAYVYACAQHAGSVHIAITQKRSSRIAPFGPYALRASSPLLAQVIGKMVPPASPKVPTRVAVAVTTFVVNDTNAILKMAQPKGSSVGWVDRAPWPVHAGYPTPSHSYVVSSSDDHHFVMFCNEALPTGVTAPSMMAWRSELSRFEPINVVSVTAAGGGNFNVVTSSAIGFGAGAYISPLMGRHEQLALAVEAYFDSLGPAEIVQSTDSRIDRAARFPSPDEEAPYRGGQAIVAWIVDRFAGLSMADAQLVEFTSTRSDPPGPYVPEIDPNETIQGPGKLTLGQLAVYDLS